MNRNEGLVRRNKARPDENSDSGNGDGSASSATNDFNDNNSSDIDVDSKETRLTLMEEVLLLGLKDKEVIK